MPVVNRQAFTPDEDPQITVGRKIVALRVFAGMTQAQLAQKTGIPQSNISRIESGKYNPTIKSLRKIAAGLDKKLDIDFS